MMEIGKIIKELREARGLSRRQLADLANIGRSTVQGVEWRNAATLYTLERILAAMDCRLVIVENDTATGTDCAWREAE